MLSVNIGEVKTNFSYYLNLAIKKGQVITVCNHNVPVAELKPIVSAQKSRVKFGTCKDKIILPDDFNKTSSDITDSFYANNIFPKNTQTKTRKKK